MSNKPGKDGEKSMSKVQTPVTEKTGSNEKFTFGRVRGGLKKQELLWTL